MGSYYIHALKELLGSGAFSNFLQIVYAVLFWLSIPLTLYVIWKIFCIEKEKKRKLKQIEKDIHSPGMEDVRNFLKTKLKECGVEIDDKWYEKN